MTSFSRAQRQTVPGLSARVPSRSLTAVQRRTEDDGVTLATEPSALDAPVREAAEQRLGFDFRHVRIHTDERAATAVRVLHARPPAIVARKPEAGAAKGAPPSKEVAERQARNAYPRNPRGAALYTKMLLGTITKDETSELHGINSFPENPRAAALYAKYDAGTIKPDELAELRGYFGRQATRDSALREGPGLAGSGRESPRATFLRAQQAKGPLSREEQAELQGLDGYPDNPRAAALYKKKVLGEKLTREEQAELQGFDIYPFNRRAAVLYVKEVMGTITWPEWHELHEENYIQAMGEFLIRLEGQARKGTMWPEHRWVYERLRNDPKVRHRAMQIQQSGRYSFSVFD